MELKLAEQFTHQNWDYTIDYANFQPENALGLSAGVFWEFLNLSNFSVVTELNYIRNSVSKELPVTSIDNPDGNGTTINWKFNLDYVGLAVLAKAKINFYLLSPYIFAGPTFNYEVRNSVTGNSDGFYNDLKEKSARN